MTVFLPWVLGTIFLIMVLAVFLWPKHNRAFRKNIPEKKSKEFDIDVKEEFAEEIAPSIKYNPPVQTLGPELPHSYGVDRLVLLVRDPDWLYAYWEITATKQEEFNSNHGPTAWTTSRPALRLYDITGIKFNGSNANSILDISISDESDNWSIFVGQPNRAFCLDLGRILPDGRFITLMRSNIVTTPRVSISEIIDEEWLWIEGLYKVNRYQVGISSPLIIEEIAERMGMLPLNISSPGMYMKEENLKH